MDNTTPNNWDTKTMIEILLQNQNTNREEARADTKEAREENQRLAKETNAKIDLMASTLNTQIANVLSTLNMHVADDAKNFKEQTKNASDNFQMLSDRITTKESADSATDKVKEKGFGRVVGLAGAVCAMLTVLIMAYHYFIQVPQHEADMELQKAQAALSERQHQAPVQVQPVPAS
jgi:hypothetical protein